MDYDITLAMVILMAVHLTIVWVCLHVLQLSYTGFLAAMVVSGVLGGLLVKAAGSRWKATAQAILQRERRDGTSGLDSLGGFLVILAGAAVSQMLIARHFGLGGWAGLFAANLLTHIIV